MGLVAETAEEIALRVRYQATRFEPRTPTEEFLLDALFDACSLVTKLEARVQRLEGAGRQ